MKKIILLLIILVTSGVSAKIQKTDIQTALNKINKKLNLIKNYSANFSVDVISIKGKIKQTGIIIQQPPYTFKRDMKMTAMGGIMNVRELTVSNGKQGWQVEFAPDGSVVNASKWGEISMEELFAAFISKSYVIMLTEDKTNTYTSLFKDIDFTKVKYKDNKYIFTGTVNKKSQKYIALLKLAASLGEEGVVNYMPEKVKLVINDSGIATEYIQFNKKNEPIVSVKLSNIKINIPLNKKIFSFTPPKNVIVMDIGKALQRDKIHVQHPLLKKRAPIIKASYLAGKKIKIKPGKQPIVLTFFSSWSGNSRKYLTGVDKLYGKFNLQGVKFISITDETDKSKLKDMIATEHLTLPIYIDYDKTTIKNYSTYYVPKTFVINRAGIVIDVLEGNAPGTLSALKESIEKTLN